MNLCFIAAAITAFLPAKIDVDAFLISLKIMGKGLAGIFLVTLIIVLSIVLLNRLTSPKKKNSDTDEKKE